MPRQERQQSATGIYHVMLRGINKQDIFVDHENRPQFSTLPYSITDPQLETVCYYDGYGFIGMNLTGAMPAVSVNTSQEHNAVGFLTGQVAYATNGETVGTVNIYDLKGQVVRSVRKGLGGRVEDVSSAYTFTGDVSSTSATVGVGYGNNFTVTTAYTYGHGIKTGMSLSVSHGRPALTRGTEYTYDAVGRLSSRRRQLTTTAKSYCTYSYDVHGWLTSISSGTFREYLYYDNGLDGGCWNGNISTVTWKTGSNSTLQGYNLKYDDSNRLYSAVFGTGSSLTSTPNYFNESVQYDCNGNITGLQRRGRVNSYGSFGLVDNLTMTYTGNMLTSVRDDASHSAYAGATDFDGVSGQEYPLTYNGAGSLMSDAGRRIARIDYDLSNNPVRIQFTNGNVTKYVYSPTGEKLRVTHQTAVPNISVPIGSTRELTPYEIQYADSTDYLLGGSLTLKNGRIDRLQFEEGYCQAESYVNNSSQDVFTFCYYDRDHLGNIRQVTEADGSSTGSVIQTMNYYPFGAEFCDGSANSSVQSYKYNGKELDLMHGLNTYDYGARQYNPVTAHWDRVDPLCEKYYSLSPYVYCGGNPINAIDVNGDSIFVLIAPRMALGFGHMALLIQNDKGNWAYYSKNGTDEWFTLYGEPRGDDRGETTFSTIYDFLNNPKYNPYDIDTDERKYTEGFLIPATHEEDVKARKGALSELNKKYNALGSNCATTVQSALRAAGKGDGFPSPPSPIMFYNQNCPSPNMDYYYLVSIKSPKIIYENIKRQNQGETMKSYR